MKRLIDEKTLKTKNGVVIINDAVTIEDNGDAVIGRNLEIDGALTIGGEPVTPGGGGLKLYKHSLGDNIIIISSTNTPIVWDEVNYTYKFNDSAMYPIINFIYYDTTNSHYSMCVPHGKNSFSVFNFESFYHASKKGEWEVKSIPWSLTDVVTEL